MTVLAINECLCVANVLNVRKHTTTNINSHMQNKHNTTIIYNNSIYTNKQYAT